MGGAKGKKKWLLVRRKKGRFLIGERVWGFTNKAGDGVVTKEGLQDLGVRTPGRGGGKDQWVTEA